MSDEEQKRLDVVYEAARWLVSALGLDFCGRIEINLFKGGGSVNVTESRKIEKEPLGKIQKL